MNENKHITHQEEKIKKWLAELQKNSWNLELIISGFSIFLLVQAIPQLEKWIVYVQLNYVMWNNVAAVSNIMLQAVALACMTLIFFLVLHLFLRGFWIGTIGLRSVVGKPEKERLGFSPLFQRKLYPKISNLENVIVRLDNVCSVLFAISFLVAFLFVSFVLFLIIVSFLQGLNDRIDNVFISHILTYIILIFIFLGLLYLFDTFTLGSIKRIKKTEKIYYPIYLFFTVLTLSFLYRILYYHIIGHYGKKAGLLLFVPIIGTMLLVQGVSKRSVLIQKGNKQYIANSAYDDMRDEDEYIWMASIPSKIIHNPYLPLFIRYTPSDNFYLKEICSDLVPSIQDRLEFTYGEDIEKDRQIIDCLKQCQIIALNGQVLDSLDYQFYVHPNKGEEGLYAVLSAENFKTGKNVLTIRKNQKNKIVYPLHIDQSDIVFWYEN